MKRLVPLFFKRWLDQLLGLTPFRLRVIAAEERLNSLDRQYMRRCFDAGREVTSVEHIIRDYEQGPEWSRDMAFRDFGKIYVVFGMDKGLVEHLHGEDRTARQQAEAERLDRKNFSIHFHA